MHPDIKSYKIYIAGPMSGYPEFNYPSFFAMEHILKQIGVETVLNPVVIGDGDTTMPYDFYIRHSLQMVSQATAIVMLDGWEKSKGAQLEHLSATTMGLPVFDQRLNLIEYKNTENVDPKAAAGAIKCPMWLIPPVALETIAWVLGLGAKKYGEYNWRMTKIKASTYISAIMRHLMAWHRGEDLDPESGKSHIAHIGACCAILLDAIEGNCIMDDRQKQSPKH